MVALLTGVAVFGITIAVLRGVEWLYHRLRHTLDWSPHWGSWAFALLAGLFAFVEQLGR
jgi:hypothetical protein